MQKTNDVKKGKTEEVAVKETKTVTEPAAKETKPAAAKKEEETTKKAAETKKETETKKAPAKSTEKKTTTSKTTTSKSTSRKKVAETVYVQYAGREFELSGIVEKAKAAYTGDVKKIKEISVYVKPEENMIYFVVNGEETGSVEL